MADIGQIQYNVRDNNGQYIGNNKYNIFDQNLVEAYPANRFTKVGIQAPPGTKVIMSKSNKVIIIGRTGIYELDENIPIDYLRFEHPIEYKFDQDATQEALNEGINALKEAEKYKKETIDTLDPDSETYWEDYTKYQDIYFNKYKEALALYKKGVNGVYDPVGEKDLDDIIIDFIYE